MPRVSIGLPVYNAENYLEETLESLLGQTFSDLELVISDNGSTDGTREICRRYAARDRRIQLHENETNRGAAWNYNRVFELARGEYFRWAAHDDLCSVDLVERCVAVLDRDPGVILCYPRTVMIDGRGNTVGRYDDGLDLSEDVPHRRLGHLVRTISLANAIFGVIRREILGQTRLIGPYLGSDIVLLMELSLYGKFHELPDHLFFRRDHESNVRKLSPAERNRWFDASGRKISESVQVNVSRGLYTAIMRAPLSVLEKTACLVQLARWLLRKWRDIGGRYKARMKEALAIN